MTTENTTPQAPAAAAAATPAAETPAVEVDEFAAAFAEATAPETSDAKPAEGAKPAADAAPAAAADAADAGAVESPDAAVAATEAAAAGADAPAAAAAPAAKPDELAQAQARIAELEAAAKVKAPEPSKPEAKGEDKPETPAEPTPKWYAPTDEEKAVLNAYETEWPEVSKAEAIRTKAAVWNAVQFMFAELQKAYGPKFAQLEEVTEVVGTMQTLGALRSAHNDYDEVRDKTEEWVKALPVGYVRKAALAVLESGTPEEVSELIAEYKKANPTPLAAVPAAGAAPKSAPKSKTGISAAAMKAAGTLGVVDSKRTTQAAAPSADDFEGAWAEATAS